MAARTHAMAFATAMAAAAAAAPLKAAPASYTLTDGSKLSATVSAAAADFGQVTDLRIAGAPDGVIAQGAAGPAVWAASFVGAGSGTATVSSSAAKCNSTSVLASSPSSLTLRWEGCAVEFGVGDNVTWVEHNASNCAGQCLAKKSNGPKGGHCDRMPGCGHDAGLPYCDVEAMKARCLGAPGCTAFNTNGYLYSGGGVTPFHEYPLSCWTDSPPPPPPPPPSTCGVTLEYSVTEAGLLELVVAFDGDGSVSLWDYTLALGRVVTAGFTGAVSTNAAKQFTGLWNTSAQHDDAVYFAAHDPEHVVKTCSASPSGGSLSCKVLALNATLPLREYRAAFPVAATVMKGDWWDLTQVYRAWVLPNAKWTSLGPLEQRTDMPDWLENITLWMNNNWGGDPLGPNYGGDPEYVKNEMLKVNQVLDLPSHGGHLALHWYEWDTLGYALGSNHTKCDRTIAPCGFDTHYPEYFPARVGCKESIKAMQDAGMRVIPYINGQLFDTLIPKYTNDSAIAAVQKFVADETMRTDGRPVPLTPHLEHFDHITSAVMCPATDYWHNIMRDTVLEIVNEVGFDGCYVDQVGNGETRNCADPSHNHTINGGSFWAEAFYSIMTEVRKGIPPKSGMFMTEGTVEEVSGPAFDILLGLEWTSLPYWHAIYGGYGYATGRAGSISTPLGQGLCTELTKQFMVGGTMGWFTYQNYAKRGDFFNPTNADYVAYIRALSQARITAKAWMVHGRATRTLNLNDTTGSLLGGCFLRDARQGEPASVVCAVAMPTKPVKPPTDRTFSLALEPAMYGLDVPSGGHVELSDLATGATLGSFAGAVTYSASVPPLTVRLLKLAVVGQ